MLPLQYHGFDGRVHIPTCIIPFSGGDEMAIQDPHMREEVDEVMTGLLGIHTQVRIALC